MNQNERDYEKVGAHPLLETHVHTTHLIGYFQGLLYGRFAIFLFLRALFTLRVQLIECFYNVFSQKLIALICDFYYFQDND